MLRRFLLRNLFGSLVWHVPARDPVLYITFDDGPIPEVTPWVLDTLDAYHAHATFFCVGDNVRKHPGVYAEVKKRGHAVGNHTMHHLNGWKTPTVKYIDDVNEGAGYIASTLFRPPYGRITRRQLGILKEQYSIIMWDVLSRDYEVGLSGQQCLQNVLRNAKPGSIIVFHDSLKAFPRLKEALPATLEHFHKLGFRFESLKKFSPQRHGGTEAPAT